MRENGENAFQKLVEAIDLFQEVIAEDVPGNECASNSCWPIARVGAALPALLVLIGCGAALSITHPPRFAQTTCVAALPQARTGYPGAWATLQNNLPNICAQGGRGGPEISGFDLMQTYDRKESSDPGDRAFQYVAFTGVRAQPTLSCGDTEVPVIIRILEYFEVPAEDLLASFCCCEEMLSASISAQVAIVSLDDLPAGLRAALPPIPAGENAERLDNVLNAAQRRTARQRIRQDGQIRWFHRYDSDGCNLPPNSTTPCGQRQCLDVWWRDSDGRHSESFAGP